MGRPAIRARVLTAPLLAGALISGVGAGDALAKPPWAAPIIDCAFNGRLDRDYPKSLLLQALHHLPSDGGEYSDCANALRAAIDGGSGRPAAAAAAPGIVTESGAVAADDADIAALQRITAAAVNDDAPKPVHVGRQTIAPSLLQTMSPVELMHGNVMPAPLVACVAGLALLAAMSCAALVKNRNAGV